MIEQGGLDYETLFKVTPCPCLVLRPDLIIEEANDAYLSATGRERRDLVGKHIFDALPLNPDDPQGDGVENLRASLERARDSGRADGMALQRYDIPVGGTGTFVERWWSPVNVPLLGEDGVTRLLFHRVDDVTDFVRERGLDRSERAHQDSARRTGEEAETELFVRAREAEALNARLHQSGERERRRWARELHDQTLQGLGGLRGMLASAREHGDQDALGEAVDVAVELLADEIANLRYLIVELRPAELDELGLQAALEELARRSSSLDGVDVRLDVDLSFERGERPDRLAPDVEITVYRVVQEALRNVARHAHVSHAEVSVIEDDDTVRAVVSDDGAGFDTAATPRGLGLTGMRERGELVGGTLALTSQPGQGTRVEVRAPAVHQTAAPREHGD